MPIIRMEMVIDAPQQICFDVARSIDYHMESTAGTQEKAIAGVTSGLIGLGEAGYLGQARRLAGAGKVHGQIFAPEKRIFKVRGGSAKHSEMMARTMYSDGLF